MNTLLMHMRTWGNTLSDKILLSILLSCVMLASTAVANNNDIQTQECPKSFYTVKLPNNGKLCQVFATELPASMIFFVPQAPSEVLKFFKQGSSEFSTTTQLKQRYMLKSNDKTTTLIISADGKGTQVDVLVIGDLSQALANKQ